MNREARAAHWQQKVDEFQASKQTAKAWCADNGIALPTFHYWRKKLAGPTNSSVSGKEEICWLELSPKLPATRVPTASIIVQVGAANIQVHAGFDPALLREVVSALGSEAC